jgi:hypothetical protein
MQEAGDIPSSRPILWLLCLSSKLPADVVEGGLDNGKKVN